MTNINIEKQKDRELLDKHLKEMGEKLDSKCTWEEFRDLLKSQLDETIRKSHNLNPRLVETGFASEDPKEREKEGLRTNN